MRCGRGHDHANIQEVKACYNLPADLEVRVENLVPAGPAPADPVKARETAQKKAVDALNRQKAAAGEIHGFTARCPQCVAGSHPWQGYKDIHAEMNAEDNPEPAPVRNGFNGRPNKYPGTCVLCGRHVAAQAGLLGDRGDDGRFTVRHMPRQCPEPVAMPRGDAASHSVTGNGRRTPTPLPDVPEGHYAIPSLTGNNDLDFFRVDRPTEGEYAGKTYIKRVIGGHPDKNIRFNQFRPVLEAILKFGVDESGLLYGQKIKSCRWCNKSLTQFASRQLSCGETCAGYHGLGELWAELQSQWHRDNPGKDAKDLGDDEGWLDQVTLKERMRRADDLAAAEQATWD